MRALAGMNGSTTKLRTAASHAPRRQVVLALLAGGLALAAGSTAAAGQIVTGTVIIEGTGAPARGAWIAVFDSLDRQRTAVLTDAAGRFSVHVSGIGPVHLRAQLIGHADGVSAVLDVQPGQPVAVTLSLRERALPLDAITVEAERRCDVTPEAGAAAFLWEEVKKALRGVSLTGRANLVAYRVQRFERTLGLDYVPQSEKLDTVTTRGDRPFTTPPPQDLVEQGYVQGFEELSFYAPDADVLLSDGFAATHCFRARPGRGETGSMVGLAFEPNADRRLPDVAGTLWIDTATSALRFLQFEYTGVDFGPRTRELGGRLDFNRLETGAWIVQKWWIRGPVLLARRASTGGDLSRRTIGAFKEAGAEVLEIVSYRGTGARPDR
jgi:hypothetical protein